MMVLCKSKYIYMNCMHMSKVIEGFHCSNRKVHFSKRYKWFIPKELVGNVEVGDTVLAAVKGGVAPVLVVRILKWDYRKHKPVVKIIEKNKKLNIDNDLVTLEFLV